MEICVWMAPVYESLTPGTRRELPIADGEAFEIECAHKPQATPEGSAVHHDGRLHQADFPERARARDGIGVGVEEHRVRADSNGG
jgi:hypothetical protein